MSINVSALPAWMPGAIRKPVPYRAEAGRWVTTPLGWILHVVVGNGSPFETFRRAVSPARRFAHWWVAKDGTIEQYAETFYKSWAQGAGNPQYFSVETEGLPTEPLTPEQIAALARIHDFLDAADVLAEAPGQVGIGTHYMGRGPWGAHSCPDPERGEGTGPRSHQRADVIRASGVKPLPAKPVPAAVTNAAPEGTDRRRVARLQQLLEVTADGLWGEGTDEVALRMRTAARAHVGYPTNTVQAFREDLAQKVLDVTADGLWGPNSQAALVRWVKAAQVVLAVDADGAWGPGTDKAFLALRAANRGKF